jgi:putative intracellular protease/amidase
LRKIKAGFIYDVNLLLMQSNRYEGENHMTQVNILLFDDFETLDAFGPAEIFGKLEESYQLGYYSLAGGMVRSRQGILAATQPLAAVSGEYVLLVPGGQGTRGLVNDADFIWQLQEFAERAEYVLAVCTGSALLAKTGLLQGRKATSNKRALAWAMSVAAGVNWQKKARWVVDGKYYTSSGVSAGMDMALGFIADRDGMDQAESIARQIEYTWHRDKDEDPFVGNA